MNNYNDIGKKAEVPIVILVLGVLLLCILLFASFKLFPFKKSNAGLEEIVIMEQCWSLVEQYAFYSDNKAMTGYTSEEQIKNLPIFKIDNKEKGFSYYIEGNSLHCNSQSINIGYPLNQISP